ncbi:flagellin [Nereida sp. MMG025]|uniref:flagellin n=1 Tax=Nereida sp. MMG025 TaxID=2909981 RepID=UPI001F26F1CC|nr:flagellin [Nereida sp. MMG025]MCF6444660.1 hypothetical protein [Nereida sp. MMG025]
MFIGFGDMAQSYQMRRLTAEAKADIAKLSTEVTTGVAADLSDHLRGNMRPIASIETTLSRLDTYQLRTKEIVLQSQMMQTSLEGIEAGVADVLQVLTTSVNFPTDGNLDISGNEAAAALRSSIQALNISGPNGALFSGVETGRQPFGDAQALLGYLDSLVASATDAQALTTDLANFFADPAGFDTLLYQGSDVALAPMQISDTQNVTLDARANRAEIKDTLHGLALAYVADATSQRFAISERADLASAAYSQLLQSQTPLSEMRADIGRTQETLETAQLANAAQSTSYQLARQALIGIDPYEAATALENQQTQLETIYAITARLSRLNLTDFL